MANIQLSDNLKQYRDSFGFTQQDLADRINISRQAYSNYETGKRAPDLDLLIKLYSVYDITLDQLILQPFSGRDLIREARTPYHINRRSDNREDLLALTEEEAHLILELRKADWEKQHLVAYILNH